MTEEPVPASSITRMTVAEFRRLGLLREVNRQFLHPLGLALEVVTEGDEERFGEVWDYRDDPEGMAFGTPLSDDLAPEASDYVDELREQHRVAREAVLGDGVIVQPIGFAWPGE